MDSSEVQTIRLSMEATSDDVRDAIDNELRPWNGRDVRDSDELIEFDSEAAFMWFKLRWS